MLRLRDIRRHLANLTATLEELLPITDAAIVDVEDTFLNWIEPLALEAPYGRVWYLGTGILSHDDYNDEYCYFRLQGTPWPDWLEIKDRLHPHLTHHLKPTICKTVNWLGGPLSLYHLARAMGLLTEEEERALERLHHKHQDRLTSPQPLTWHDLTQEELQALTRLHHRVTRTIKKELRAGIHQASKERTERE